MLRILTLLLGCVTLVGAADLVSVEDSLAAARADSLSQVQASTDTLHSDSLDALTANREEPDTIEYSAVDLEYDFPTQTFNLNNQALIKYRGATLTADTIWFDQADQVMQASGDPILKDPKNPPLSGYRMKYNMKTRIGQVFYGSSFRENQRFNGMDIRRLPDNRLQLARGDFSTCNDSTHQHYYFYSRRMVVEPKENIVASPVVLNIADVPVAVLPILVSPLKSGRRSGLLTPKFGGDQKQGFYMRDLGFYWAINDYMDATAKGDVVEGSEARFERSTASAEFNYVKRYVLDGQLKGTAYMEEFDLANSGWDLHFKHKQELRPDGKSTLSGEGDFVSSQNLRKDRALDETTILNQQANAHMTWDRTFSNSTNLTVNVRQNHNLVTDHRTREIPDVQFRTSGPLIPFLEGDGSPVEDFFSRFNFGFTNRSNHYTVSGRDTVLDQDTTRRWLGNTFTTSLNWSGQLLRVFNVRPTIQYQGDWSAYEYQTPHDSLDRRPQWRADVDEGERGQYFGTYSMGVGTDTKLYGIWRPDWGRFVGIRHTVTPGVSYTWAPELDTNFAFVPHPLMGQRIAQSEQKTVGMNLSNDFDLKYLVTGDTSRVGDKESSRNLRVLNTRHSTSYNFAADSLNWSPIQSSFGLQVIPDYVFTVGTIHNVYHRFSDRPSVAQTPELTQWNYELSRSFQWGGKLNAGILGDPEEVPDTRPWKAGFNYRYSFTSVRVGRNLFQDQISHSSSISLGLQPTRHWNMTYATQYDYNAGEFAKHELNFSRDLHCWSLTFRWTPTGPAAGWYFSIFITELPDIKLQSGDTRTPSSR